MEDNQMYDEDGLLEEIKFSELERVVINPKSWTPTVFYELFEVGDIDIKPKFQRRNAWDDDARGKFIESLMIGYPVPEIILAEVSNQPHRYIVIDGKQRLTSIIGFMKPEYEYWKESKIKNLKVRTDLNDLTYKDFEDKPNIIRRFRNVDIRCAIIQNVPKYDILYDMFIRLNTSFIQLSMQELRQALYPGPFSDYLMEITDVQEKMILHKIAGFNAPDQRLEDVEIILKFFANYFFMGNYKGSLRAFLDESIDTINKEWIHYEDKVKQAYETFNDSLNKLYKGFNLIFTDELNNYKKIGRLPDISKFNKAVFEAQVYFFAFVDESLITKENFGKFVSDFQIIFNNDREFSNSLRLGTNNQKGYVKRFQTFEHIINESFGTNIEKIVNLTNQTINS
ncbi:MAG: DUF262 domain-containing protein [Microscillaceae bacterium]|nr:DUF262 domain-containing protein [Microscillaceae bacterium]